MRLLMWSGVVVPCKTTNLDISLCKGLIFRNMYVDFVQELHSRWHCGVNIGLLRKRKYRLLDVFLTVHHSIDFFKLPT